MTFAERSRYHQLHPLKLAIDWTTAIAAGALFWLRRPFEAAVLGFGPSILASAVFLSGRVDGVLESVRRWPAARTIAPELSFPINVMRFGGLALAWSGCWFHLAGMIGAGLAIIVGAWALAWRLGVSRSAAGREAS